MTKVIVYHATYGCDTGCCGHTIKCDSVDKFEFRHPHKYHPYKEDHKKFAEQLVKDCGLNPDDLDWENCVISED